MSLLESSKAITPSASYKPAAITCVWATPGFYKFLDECAEEEQIALEIRRYGEKSTFVFHFGLGQSGTSAVLPKSNPL
jgi:hypothetical protein